MLMKFQIFSSENNYLNQKNIQPLLKPLIVTRDYVFDLNRKKLVWIKLTYRKLSEKSPKWISFKQKNPMDRIQKME